MRRGRARFRSRRARTAASGREHATAREPSTRKATSKQARLTSTASILQLKPRSSWSKTSWAWRGPRRASRPPTSSPGTGSPPRGGVAGASEDLSRVYFVSREAIPGSGGNGEGEEAQDGQPNLYLSEAGGFEFIATLVAGDVGVAEPGAVNILAYSLTGGRPATRVTPDGAAIAFQTRAPVGSFDNSAVGSLKPAVEVYLYQAGGELRCVSCNPSGARPVARKLGEAYKPRGIRETGVIAAACTPTWEQPQHDSNVLSEDGSRLFFNANDALVPHDANGAQDVYEWEAAGPGRCDTG